MAILFDSARTHNPATFGRGLSPCWSGAYSRLDYTAADAAWLAAQDASEPDWDALAEDAANVARHERGLCYA